MHQQCRFSKKMCDVPVISSQPFKLERSNMSIMGWQQKQVGWQQYFSVRSSTQRDLLVLKALDDLQSFLNKARLITVLSEMLIMRFPKNPLDIIDSFYLNSAYRAKIFPQTVTTATEFCLCGICIGTVDKSLGVESWWERLPGFTRQFIVSIFFTLQLYLDLWRILMSFKPLKLLRTTVLKFTLHAFTEMNVY